MSTKPSRRRPRKQRRAPSHLASGALAVGAAVASAQSTEAATFNVTNLNDSGAGSLRQAVADANAAAGADTITFQADLTGTITLTSGQLAIDDSVDILGPGPSVLTVSGATNESVFYLYSPSSLIDVTISGLTITGGDSGFAGGGIASYNQNLVLDDVVVTGNHADNLGGGVALTSGDFPGLASLTITNSTISNNTSSGGCCGIGGGVYAGGAAQVAFDNTTIDGNSADAYGGVFVGYVSGAITLDQVVISNNAATAGPGGGLAVVLAYGDVQVIDSTISGNQTTSGPGGGGILLYAVGANVVVENSTISGNEASGRGGGILMYASSATIRHTTISGNTASVEGGGIYAYGIPADLSNSIVADNSAPSNNDLANAPPDAFNISFTLVEDPGAATINDIGGNIFNQDPQLGALQNNGGATETHKPAATSPVIDAGDPAFTPPPSADQRGFPREVPDGGLDMGAVELNAGTVQFAVSADSVAENGGSITVTVTRTGGLDDAASVPVSVSGGTATGGGVDYTFGGITLNWADGDSADKTFNITINDDLVFEGNETIVLQLGAPTGAALGSPSAETITINDNEPQPTISIGDVSLNEGDAGTTTFPFTVTLSGPSALTVTVNFTTSPLSATEGTDYADNTGIVTFAPLDTSETIDVSVNGDLDVEPDETFTVDLSAPSGAAIDDGSGLGTIQNDDVVTTTDLSITKTLATPGPFTIGENITFNITVTNNGLTDATSVVVTDAIPASTSFVSATPSQGSCVGTTTVTCTLGTINNDSSATILLVLQANGPGTNTAIVFSPNDSTSNNNAGSAAFELSADNVPTLSETMQLVLAALIAMIALGVIGKKIS